MRGEINNGAYGRALRQLLDVTHAGAGFNLAGDVLPVVLADDLTIGHASPRRWIGGSIFVNAAAGVTGRVYVSVQSPNTIAVVMPYISGPALSYRTYGAAGTNPVGTSQVYCQDIDLRRASGNGNTGIVRLDADPNTSVPLTPIEDISSQNNYFMGAYVISANEGAVLQVACTALAQQYWVGVVGWVVQNA